MTLREKILQTFVVTIREVNRFGGPEAFFSKFPVGGIYFSKIDEKDYDGTPENGTLYTKARLDECVKASRVPLLVCADGVEIPEQEVKIITQSPIGSSKNLEDAYNLGKIFGMQMNANGVDWLLGSIVDFFYDKSMPLFAFSDDAEFTARVSREIIRGI